MDHNLADETESMANEIARQLRILRDIRLPQLRQSASHPGSDQQVETESDIKRGMQAVRENLTWLKENVEELEWLQTSWSSAPYATKPRHRYTTLQMAYEHARQDIRIALLDANRYPPSGSRPITVAQPIMAYSTPSLAESQLMNAREEDAVMAASHHVTQALKRTTKLMSEELEKSSQVNQVFEESSQTIRSTLEEYVAYSDLVQSSKIILKKLEKGDWLDRVLVVASMVLFFLVVAYILKKRFVDRGIGLLYFWTKLLPNIRQKQILPSYTSITVTTITTFTTSTVGVIMNTLQRTSPSPSSQSKAIQEHDLVASLIDSIPSPITNDKIDSNPSQEHIEL